MTLENIKKKLFYILEGQEYDKDTHVTPKRRSRSKAIDPKPKDIPNCIFDAALITLITLNVIAATAASFDYIYEHYSKYLYVFEVFSIAVFSVEYLLRLFVSPRARVKPTDKLKKHPHLRFIFSLEAIIDLAAVAPFYIPLVTGIDFRFLRIYSALRMLRIFKFIRYNQAIITIKGVLRKEKEKLIATMFLTLMMIFVASAIMYYMENDAQPEQFRNIIQTTWWSIASFTNIWYGDIYPITMAGKICGGVISILGVMLIALPSGILCSGFMKEMRDECPNCDEKVKPVIWFKTKGEYMVPIKKCPLCKKDIKDEDEET
jgi:voltage-gated potassium channel